VKRLNCFSLIFIPESQLLAHFLGIEPSSAVQYTAAVARLKFCMTYVLRFRSFATCVLDYGKPLVFAVHFDSCNFGGGLTL